MSKRRQVILWTVASLAFLLQVDFLYADYRRVSQPVEIVAQRLAPNAMRDVEIKGERCTWEKEDSSWVTVYDLMLYNRSEFHCYDTLRLKLCYKEQYNRELPSLTKMLIVYRTIQPGDSVQVKGVRTRPVTDKDRLKIDGVRVEIVN